MTKKYRVEIPSINSDNRSIFYIGSNLELVTERADAGLITEEEMLLALERMDIPCTAYDGDSLPRL